MSKFVNFLVIKQLNLSNLSYFNIFLDNNNKGLYHK